MAPGPESSGIANGVSEISSLSVASSVSATVMRLVEVTIPQAVLATIRPPAIFSTGSEMPKKDRTKRPKNKNTTRIAKTKNEVLSAVRRRSTAGHDEVKLKKIGTPPKGSTIGNRARNVAAAEAGNVRRNCPNAFADVMLLSCMDLLPVSFE